MNNVWLHVLSVQIKIIVAQNVMSLVIINTYLIVVAYYNAHLNGITHILLIKVIIVCLHAILINIPMLKIIYVNNVLQNVIHA